MPRLITGDQELVELGDEMQVELSAVAELSWSCDSQVIVLRRIEGGKVTDAKVATVEEFLKDLTIPKKVYVRDALIAAGIITKDVQQEKPHVFEDEFDVGIFLKTSGIAIEKLVHSIAVHVQKDIDKREKLRNELIEDMTEKIRKGEPLEGEDL